MADQTEMQEEAAAVRRQDEEFDAPHSRGMLWFVRVVFAVQLIALCVFAIAGEWQVLALVLPAIFVITGYEWFVRHERAFRRDVFREGERVSGVVIEKHEVRGMNRVRLQYDLAGVRWTYESYVGDATYFRAKIGGMLWVRVRPRQPAFWVAEVGDQGN